MSQYTPQYPAPDIEQELREIFRRPYAERQRILVEGYGYPQHLYRYTSLDPTNEISVARLRQVLVDSELWLSSPADFNDPFDMSCHVVFNGTGLEKRRALVEKFKQIATTWKKRNQRIDELMADPEGTLQQIRGAFEKNLQAVGVCCFTTDPHNLLMWSHYANNHKGILLEFDPVHDPVILTRPVRVTYTDDYPVVNWADDTYSQLKRVLLQKSNVWKYEDELRIVHPDGAHTRQLFNPSGLIGVFVGCRATEASKEKLQELLVEREKRGYPAVTIYQSEMHSTQYKLVLRKM